MICAPFHNPLRLAEDIAAVDIASNGRFDLGIGVGSQWEEFDTFGIDPKERFGRTWEIIDIIDRCLHSEEERFDHVGKYYNFPNVRWIIRPVQKRIPVFWGGFGPQGVRRAAERGYHLIAPDVTGTYERVMREHGRRPEEHLIGFVNNLSIADTWEEAFQATAEPCQWVSNQYALRKGLDGVEPPESARVTMEMMRRGAETGEQLAFSVPNPGTVDQIIEKFLPVVRGERGLITHLGLEVRPPGTKTEDVHRTMRRFAEYVIPVLREEAAKVGHLYRTSNDRWQFPDRPHGLRWGARGQLYCVCENSGVALEMDPESGAIEHVIELGSNKAHRIEVLPDGSKLYTENEEDAFGTVVDLTARRVVKKIPTPNGSAGVGMSPDGETVIFVDAQEPQILVVDTASDEVRSTIRLQGTRRWETVLIANQNEGSLAVCSLMRGEVLRTVQAGVGVETLSFF